LRADLGVKVAGSTESIDLAFQLGEASDRQGAFAAESSEANSRFDAEEALLAEKEGERRCQ
jgi:hypothetical protein